MYSYIVIWNVHIRYSFADFSLLNEEKKTKNLNFVLGDISG